MKTTKILIYLVSFVFVLGITPGAANADLVAYWPMDEGEGITVSDLAGPWDGAITGNVTWVDGKVGKALEFPGGSNFVNCGNVDIGESLTLSYWCFNPDKTFERPIGQHSGNYTTDPGWCVYSRDENEGGVWFRVHGADNAWNGGDIIIADNLPKTEWFHLTFTFDGPTRELTGYLNGEWKVSKICEEGRCIYPNTNDLRFGNVGTGAAFTGMLDEVAVWNTALTADEVLAVYNLGVDQPRNPSPADGSKVPPGDVDLSWTNMMSKDPNNPGGPVYVDVWFGTEPNELHPNYDMTKVVTEDPNRTTWTVSAPTEGTYYWQVVNYAYGAAHINEPNAIAGSLWSFIAVDDVPIESVDAGVDMMTWSGQGVPLDPTVVDDGKSALTYAWSAEPVDGVTVAFDPSAAVEDPTVTMTRVQYFVPAVVNAGFEDAAVADGDWGAAPGWTAVGAAGSWNPGETTGSIGYGGNAPEGENIAWVGLDTQVGAYLGQVLTATLTPDTTYELTVEVGNSPLYDWPGYKVQLLAGGNLLAEDDNSLTPADDTFETSTVTHTSGDESDPNIGLPLEIRLLVIAAPGANWAELNFDDVRLLIDGAPAGEYMYAPEPTTVTLTLAVNDEGTPTPVEDTMTIDVYDTACNLARIGEGKDEPLDFDKNCEVGLSDLAIMLRTWLDNIELTAAVQK